MKVINKSYKLRIYPNKEQKILLEKHFGCVRFVYNHFLNVRNTEYKTNKINLNYLITANILSDIKENEEFLFLNEVNSQSLQWSLKYLDNSFRNFFRGQTKFPKFKKKSNNQSFKVPVNSTFKLEKNKIIIPKFREGIYFRGKLELENLIKFNSVNISRTPSGKYYASLQGEFNYIPFEQKNNQIGIDLGLKEFLITDLGVKVDNPKYLKSALKKLKYKQKQLSKKIKGSNNRQKQRVLVSLIHEKVANKRMDFLHKLSTKIVNENQVICLESLMVKNMIKNHKLAQSISDASWSKFLEMLKYKSEWNNRELIQIDRFYPSSKSCSECHYINNELTLKDREWICSSCGTHHDRDINAAKNILIQGLNILSGSGAESDIKQKPVEALRLRKSVKQETQSSLVIG